MIIWTFVVMGIQYSDTHYSDLRYLLWHMDSSYWFLASLWTISMIYGVAKFLSFRLSLPVPHLISTILLMGCGMAILGIIGYFAGINFFAIKYSLYYFPFFTLGYIYGQIQDSLSCRPRMRHLQDIIIAISLPIFIFLALRYDFYSCEDSPMMILNRFLASVTGSIVIIHCISKGTTLARHSILRLFHLAGIYSLEIYLIHFLFLNIISQITIYSVYSLQGASLVILNLILALAFTATTIFILKKIPYMDLILFYKK